MSNPTLFHNLPDAEQARRAALYVRTKELFKQEEIKYDDTLGMLWTIKTRNTKTFFKPHTGDWRMEIKDKDWVAGDNATDLVRKIHKYR